jgi:hypothetical protein
MANRKVPARKKTVKSKKTATRVRRKTTQAEFLALLISFTRRAVTSTGGRPDHGMIDQLWRLEKELLNLKEGKK